MPLVNSPALTSKKITANRANAQLSHGPITVEGLIRTCDAMLMEEAEAWQATRDRDRENLLRTGTPYFRDSAVAEGKLGSQVLLRQKDSSFRPVGRLTDMVLKLKRGGVARPEQKNEHRK